MGMNRGRIVTRISIGLLIAACLATVLISGLAPPRRYLTLYLTGSTNDSAGNQIAWFCLSNHSPVDIMFLRDSNALPCYSLFGALPHDPNNPRLVWTNFNQQSVLGCPQTKLWAGKTVSFPVRIPAGVTGATLHVWYMRPQGSVEEMAQQIYWEYKGQRSRSFDDVSLKQPFGSNL